MTETEIPTCASCGAQLAVQPGATQVACGYCGRINVLAGGAPPAAPMPQANLPQQPMMPQQPAMQGQVPNYSPAPSNLGRKIALFVGGLVMLVLVGVGVIVYMVVSGVQETVSSAVPSGGDFAPSVPAGGGGSSDEPSEPMGPLLGDGAKKIPGAIEGEVGTSPVKVRRLTIHDDSNAEAIVDRSGGLERYTIHPNGSILRRGGVPSIETEPFLFSDIDLSQVSSQLATAREATDRGEVSPTFVRVQRDDAGDIVWTVRFGHDNVKLDPDGNRLSGADDG